MSRIVRSQALLALPALALVLTTGTAVSAMPAPAQHLATPDAPPASLSASDWASIEQQVPPIAQRAYLKASNTQTNDSFGFSVAISGDTAVVGAHWEASGSTGVNGSQSDNGATNSGAVYVFVREGTNWTQQAYLKASNTGAGDFFGWSVAISGDTVVVGARSEASRATGVNGNQGDNGATNAGAAYVFVREGTNWIQQAYLKASNTDQYDYFGFSVAISGDTVAIGAIGEASNATGVTDDQRNNSAPYSGAAYVFVRSGTNWRQQGYLKASNASVGDSFGTSVSVSGDTLVVSAPWESSSATGVNGDQTNSSSTGSGAAYVFVRNGTNWMQQAYLKASNTDANDGFGDTVAVSGDTVVVGASWESSNATGVNSNQSDNNALRAGAAYVFVRNGTNWSQQAYLKASNTGTDDRFGEHVAVSGDTVVVGATWEDSSATGVNGNQSDISATNSGATYVFVRRGTNWSQQVYLKASNTGAYDLFGWPVAASGNTLVVGAQGEDSNASRVNGDQSDNSAERAGAAYIFTGAGTGPQLAFAADGSGGYLIRFAGHAGFTSELQRAPGVTGPWSSILTNTAPPSGLVELRDTTAPPGQAFYRVVQP